MEWQVASNVVQLQHSAGHAWTARRGKADRFLETRFSRFQLPFLHLVHLDTGLDVDWVPPLSLIGLAWLHRPGSGQKI